MSVNRGGPYREPWQRDLPSGLAALVRLRRGRGARSFEPLARGALRTAARAVERVMPNSLDGAGALATLVSRRRARVLHC